MKKNLVINANIFLLFFLVFVSFLAFFIYYTTGQNLLYADAISRLDISRKVIDNITPGLPQLGNVWLPLPQMLMLPFIWNNFLWHSGIAGSIMSMSAFIIGGFYIFKSAKIITNSFIGSIMAVSVYALNINILYLQTTAMSESLFLCTLAATMYYFLLYFKTNNKYILIPAALSVCAMTITRYEGLAILLTSLPIVFTYSFIKNKNYATSEANTLLYGVLACLGFALWTIYLTAIFGDPLYWKNYYAGASVVKATGVSYYSQAKPFTAAVWQYFTASVWMIGLIPVLMSLLAIFIMLGKDIKNRTWYFLPLLMPLSIFLFMVLTLQRNTPIVQPDLNFANIFSSETSNQTGFNIRYGLLLLPWVAIMTAYLFAWKNIFIKSIMILIFVLLFSMQINSYFNTSYSVLYRIPARILAKPNFTLVEYMKKHYDKGKILISAAGHEDQMFMMGFDYKTYIHEGTNKYWKESLDNPPRYASWVVYDKAQERDPIAVKQNIDVILLRDYTLVFHDDQVKVYKIKHKTYFEIK
ncbi:MAG TPA: hypothetical protein VLG12_04510 [Candidatus Saccharimonadales bacterium]|nr:hypothetical protein [Candidatus Saccharimonadales bacterium]